ncbi:MAG: type II 3-dehydroquinate dehydratase [Candidatus Dasytiphilus stammeri]
MNKKNISKFHILCLNGPNLNLLGLREPEKYGKETLTEIIDKLLLYANQLNVDFEHFQSNAEHELIHKIHEIVNNPVDYIIINPAGLTHTSICLRDALLGVQIPFIEVHLSNIYKRDIFRNHSYFSDIASGIICGLGSNSYILALQAAVNSLQNH